MNGIGRVDIENFSLLKDDPFNRLRCRLRLATPQSLRISRSALAFAVFTWLPLLILSAFHKNAVGRPGNFGLLQDYSIYSRFLIAVPVLIATEAIVDRWISAIVKQFVRTKIVPKEQLPDYEGAVRATVRMRDSVFASILMIIAAYAFNFLGMRERLPLEASSWAGTASGSTAVLTDAGYWFYLVSNPLLLFLFLRWFWVYLIWTFLLWRISRMDLDLIPIHPDLSGGLGFVGIGQTVFAPVAFALMLTNYSMIANRVVYLDAAPPDFYLKSLVSIIAALAILLGPLFFFAPNLLGAKRRGIMDYEILGWQYTKAFDDKWIGGVNPEGETLLGTSDIQSLADLGNSFEFVRKMRVVPFGLSAVAVIAISVMIPLGLLQIVLIPTADIVRSIYKFLIGFTGVG